MRKKAVFGIVLVFVVIGLVEAPRAHAIFGSRIARRVIVSHEAKKAAREAKDPGASAERSPEAEGPASPVVAGPSGTRDGSSQD